MNYIMEKKITVAIPHYNNTQYMKDTLRNIITDDRVSEIIICDDKSKEEEINQLKNLVNEKNKENSKIKLYINENNLGCYHNKLKTVSYCTNDWCILLDSDNYLDNEYINKLYQINEWNTNTIYVPCWGKTFPGKPSPNLDYRIYNNTKFDYILCIKETPNQKYRCLSNTCNYFLPVKQYINCMSKYTYKREIIDSLDSAVLFTDWICDKNYVYVVDGMIEHHRLHPLSNYVTSNARKYEKNVRKELFQKLKSVK